jgi:hypothetical protein
VWLNAPADEILVKIHWGTGIVVERKWTPEYAIESHRAY